MKQSRDGTLVTRYMGRKLGPFGKKQFLGLVKWLSYSALWATKDKCFEKCWFSGQVKWVRFVKSMFFVTGELASFRKNEVCPKGFLLRSASYEGQVRSVCRRKASFRKKQMSADGIYSV